MSLDVLAQELIERPREVVAAYAMEAENDPVWIGGISESRRLTDPPTDVGTRVERVATFLGRRIEYVMEVAEYEPPTRIVLRSIKAPFPMRVTYEFEADGGMTVVRLRVEGVSEGFYRIAAPLMAGAVKRSISRDLRTLRTVLENDALL